MNKPVETVFLAQSSQSLHSSQSSQAAGSEKWSEERILGIKRWAPQLFSLRTTRHPGFRFVPGQFARLGLPLRRDEPDGEVVWRAYSMASASYDEHLEFFSIVVPDGEFTTRLAERQIGDSLRIEKNSFGFLTTDRFAGGRDLWLLASGTGVAPFLSILHDPQVWQDYENLVLVYSVREARDLAYSKTIAGLPQHVLLAGSRARLHYVPLVTRESVAGTLSARITEVLADGRLEARVGVSLDAAHSRVMVCGNPQMAVDLRRQLTERGLQVGRRGKPGQLAFENYW
ncbi:MAG: ferredoxin--NADP reductase [Sterolibacterium sp.]|nr:ferredoxin--NADP reductase [Sterolibacterium sp.]